MEEDANLMTREQYIEMPQKWSQASGPGANDMSQPGVHRDMMKRGFVAALKRRRAHECSTEN